MSGSPSVAEDVTQEVFLLLMREAAGYDEVRGSVTSYLYGVARNFVLRRLDKESRFVALPEEETRESEREPAAVPLAELTRNAEIEAVRQAVLLLPSPYREVVVL